jgi:hypothetical protein
MDVLGRYGIAGYILLAVVYLYCPQATEAFRKALVETSLGFIVLNVFIGLPLGYLVNQIASSVFHLLPFLGIRRSPPRDTFIFKEARSEMSANAKLLAALRGEFQLKEWYAWRWIHLTVNLNAVVAISIALGLSCFINGATCGRYLPLYSLPFGKIVALVALIVSMLALCYNIYLYRWFISKMDQAVSEVYNINVPKT